VRSSTPSAAPTRTRREAGVVLVVILVFALLLTSTVATFMRRATVDSMISRNREAASRAEALARGGVRLATVLLLEDALRDREPDAIGDTLSELWARARYLEIPLEDGSSLRLQIEDMGSRLNLNAVFQFDENGAAHDNATHMLSDLLEKVIDEMPIAPGEKLYDVAELVANLVDYVDEDDLRQRGGPEDDVYQDRDPPERPANRPFLSLDELQSVEGFDDRLVEGLRPYLTVYPFAGTEGINPNTAPPHVLSLLFFNDGVDLRFAEEDTVRKILKVRQEGGFICGEGQAAEGCAPVTEVVGPNAIYPPLDFDSEIFTVTAEARVGDVRRSVEAVLDRGAGAQPLLLSWRVL
jgi:type II secretory pathway component PulK